MKFIFSKSFIVFASDSKKIVFKCYLTLVLFLTYTNFNTESTIEALLQIYYYTNWRKLLIQFVYCAIVKNKTLNYFGNVILRKMSLENVLVCISLCVIVKCLILGIVCIKNLLISYCFNDTANTVCIMSKTQHLLLNKERIFTSIKQTLYNTQDLLSVSKVVVFIK